MQTRPFHGCTSNPKSQHGSALLIILTIIGIGAAFLLVSAFNKANQQIERGKITASSLAQAKDALIGYAVMYGDTHISEVSGHLPIPDLGSSRNTTPGEGVTAGNFTGNAAELSALGRLPWKTLGLSPLRDGNGECLWYAVSGAYQEAVKSAFMNWDTLGELDTYTSDGTSGGTVSTSGTNYHQRPAAVIFAPGALLTGQSRALSTVDTVTECGGNYGAVNYLDTVAPSPLINSMVNYFAGINSATGTYLFATPKSLVIGPVSDASGNTLVNDKALIITPDDIFRAIKRRNDFGTFVGGLLTTATSNLSAIPAPAFINFSANPPTETSGGTTVGSLEIGRIPSSACSNTPLKKWQDNLLYARCTSGGNCLTVNGASCKGMVIFAGERSSTTTPAQTRGSNAQKNTWSNYLEGTVLSAFTAGGTSFTGASAYTPSTPSMDVLACITAPPPGSTQVTFASNLGSFVTAGSGASASVPTQSVSVAAAGGASGGCLWYPTAIPLSGKTLRAYYTFTFLNADPIGSPDLGNGFTLSFLRGDVGSPTACGTQSYMGVLDASTLWGNMSYIVETDVHQDGGAINDPAGNHTAIMSNGNLAHSALAGGNGYTTPACNGSAQGCLYSPANTFEESPAPLNHNQRIEIHTGCDSACATCNSGGSYAQVKIWSDCVSCSNTASDFAPTPVASRCTALDASMGFFYFGFTGGFSSAGGGQGVIIRNFDLRTQ